MKRTRMKRIDADEIKYQYIKIQKYIFLCFFLYFYLLMFYQCGTVFQTAFLTTCCNPETTSRVTLALLGTVFQTALTVLLRLRLSRHVQNLSRITWMRRICSFHGFFSLL